MKKFISNDDKLKEEIEKMISLTDMEAMKEIFPKQGARKSIHETSIKHYLFHQLQFSSSLI